MTIRLTNCRMLAAVGVFVLGMAAAHAASAQTVYNVQFATTTETDGGGTPVHYVGTGALGTGGTFFNFEQVTGRPTNSTFTNLKDSNGAASSISVSVTGIEFYNATHGTPSESSSVALLGSYSDTKANAPGTFTLLNLPASTLYSIYLYALNGHYFGPYPTKTIFTIGSASASVDGTLETPFSEGHNYVRLTGTTSPAGVVTGAYTGANGGEGDFCGLQLVLSSPSVPKAAL